VNCITVVHTVIICTPPAIALQSPVAGAQPPQFKYRNQRSTEQTVLRSRFTKSHLASQPRHAISHQRVYTHARVRIASIVRKCLHHAVRRRCFSRYGFSRKTCGCFYPCYEALAYLSCMARYFTALTPLQKARNPLPSPHENRASPPTKKGAGNVGPTVDMTIMAVEVRGYVASRKAFKG